MPMTSAERCRKYREKLKESNPQKFEEMKKRNAERTKANKRKIENMNEDEKEKMRKQWRNAKRKNNKQSMEEELTVGEKKSRRRYRSQVVRENLKLKVKVVKLSLKNANLRKTLTRYRKKILVLTEQLNKLKSEEETKVISTPLEIYPESLIQKSNELSPLAKSQIFIDKELPYISEAVKQKVKQKLLQHNVLEESLKVSYQDCKKFKERNILKKIVGSDSVKKYNMQTNLTKCLGLKSSIRYYHTIKQKRIKTAKEIKEFFERDDVSRMTSGKKEYVTYKKIKKQKRFLLNTLLKLYQVYRNEGGTLSFSTFKRYRPFYIVSPNISDRNTCACVKHANLAFKAESLKKLGLIATTDLNDLVSEIVCDVKSKSCMYSECRVCSGKKLNFNITVEQQVVDNLYWFEWITKNHEFEKFGEHKVTKKTVKDKRTGSVKTLINLIQDDLIKFKAHHFNIYHQYSQYKEAIENVQGNEVIIHCDFSENYGCKMAEEVQALHFGSSKQQITLHTGVAYIKNQKPFPFCTISPSLKHGPEAIWGHLEPVLSYLREHFPIINHVHFYSDGPTTQYRQKNNFFLFSEKTKEAGFVYGTWSFFEASHGKGAADGVGGAIKRNLDSRVKYGDDVVDAKSAFEALSKTETTVKIFYVTEQNIEDVKISSPERIQPIPSTMKLHQIITTEDKNVIKYRPLSCFCTRGNCNCFATKSHVLKSTKMRKNREKKSKEKRKRTRKTKENLNSSSENTDTEVNCAENNDKKSEIKIKSDEANKIRSIVKINARNTEIAAKGIDEANKSCNVVEIRAENKEKKEKNEGVKILSEIRNTPENQSYFDLTKIGPMALKAIGMDFNLCSIKEILDTKSKSEKENMYDIYGNSLPSTSGIRIMAETLNLHEEKVNICKKKMRDNSSDIDDIMCFEDIVNEFMEEQMDTYKDDVEELRGIEEQDRITGEREISVELEDGLNEDEHGSIP